MSLEKVKTFKNETRKNKSLNYVLIIKYPVNSFFGNNIFFFTNPCSPLFTMNKTT